MAQRNASNPELNRAAVREWKLRNPEKVAEQRARHNEKRRTGDSAAARASAARTKRFIAEIVRVARALDGSVCWVWNKPGLSNSERFKVRYALDPEFNLAQRLRSHGRRAIRRDKVGDLVRAAICRGGTSPKAEAMLGYSVQVLMRHLERQFTKGMTWAAFMDGRIHIDHIVALSDFDLSDPDQWRAAWALPNLRPLWAPENIRKSDSRLFLL